jgi:hypothetical protein
MTNSQASSSLQDAHPSAPGRNTDMRSTLNTTSRTYARQTGLC